MATTAQGLVDGGLEAVQALGEQFTHITGRVVPYGVETDVGWFLEEFERGAFTNSIVKTPKIPLLLWHDNRSFPIGSAVSWDDRQDGLHARFRLAMTAVAQQAGQYARDDFLTGMSVGFSPVRSSWTYAAEWDPELGPDHMDSVTRHEARLLEVSLVSTRPTPTRTCTTCRRRRSTGPAGQRCATPASGCARHSSIGSPSQTEHDQCEARHLNRDLATPATDGA